MLSWIDSIIELMEVVKKVQQIVTKERNILTKAGIVNDSTYLASVLAVVIF